MKNFILDFKGFVNESFEFNEDAETAVQIPAEVVKIATFMVNGLFEGHKIKGIDGDVITVQLSDNDFRFAPDVIALRDFGYELWSGKPFDVKLNLDNADEETNEVSYLIEFEPKEARRAKVEKEEDEFVDDYEKQGDEFGDFPEEPDFTGGNDDLFRDESEIGGDEDDLFEGRKRVQKGGFPKLKIKQGAKKDNPNLTNNGGFKPSDKERLMKKDQKKMAETKDEIKNPPAKK